MSIQDFEEELLKATKKGWFNETQMNALLRKFENMSSNNENRKALDMQLRNSLRIMRNAIMHKSDLVQDFSYKLIQISKFEKFLEIVDKPKGVLCYRCKTGLLSRETTSSWMKKNDYQLILEQIPAEVCKNSACNEVIYSSETVAKKQKITQIVEEYIAKLLKINPENIKDTKCPLCQSNSLKEGHNGTEYKFQQTLYHLCIHDVPLLAYCEQCGYQKFGEKTIEIIDWITTELNHMVVELLTED